MQLRHPLLRQPQRAQSRLLSAVERSPLGAECHPKYVLQGADSCPVLLGCRAPAFHQVQSTGKSTSNRSSEIVAITAIGIRIPELELEEP